MRPLVENTKNRQRITVLNAGCKVTFASNSNNAARARLHHNAAGNGAARGYGKPHTIFVPQGKQLTNRAFAATLTVVRIMNKPLGAQGLLNAMR